MTYSSHHDTSHLYFITATIVGWKTLFEKENYRQIVLNSLVWLRKEGRMFLYTFVIMPNHLHLILKPRNRGIGQLLQEFGSFTAHAALKELRKEEQKLGVRSFSNIKVKFMRNSIILSTFLLTQSDFHQIPIAKSSNQELAYFNMPHIWVFNQENGHI